MKRIEFDLEFEPVGDFRNSSDEGAAQEFDDSAWLLAIKRRYDRTRPQSLVYLIVNSRATEAAAASSTHVAIAGDHIRER